jgi:hypothetical protein
VHVLLHSALGMILLCTYQNLVSLQPACWHDRR